MKTERRSGNIAYLFSLAEEKPRGWYRSIVLNIIGIVAEAIPFIAIYFIVRHFLEATSSGTDLESSKLWFWSAITAGSFVLSITCTLMGGYEAHKSAFRLIYGLRRTMLSRLGNLPMGYFASSSTGEIQKQMESNMSKVEQLMAHNIPNLIGSGPLVIALLLSMFILNAWLGLAVLIPVAIAYIVQGAVMSSKKNRQNAVEGSQKLGDMNRWFNEYLRGISVVKVFGGEGRSFEKLHQSINNYLDYMLNFIKKTSMPFSLFKVLMLSVLSFVLPVATLLISVYGGELQLVLTILMFLIITPCLYSPVLEIMRLGVETQQANVAIDQIEALVEMQPLAESPHPQIPQNFDVRFEDVSFSYQSASDPMRRFAIENLSFQAKTGTVTALVGPSGGGKSTVGQLICRFWDVTQGVVSIGGIDIRDISLSTLMDIIAFVFQDTFIFSSTVYENIAMNRETDFQSVEAAAKAAMCHDFIMALPNGYETKLGDGGLHLSGGEAQRIAIARAILKDSPIVVLDEATASTDADNEAMIQKALNRLLSDKTVIVIAHRLATIQTAGQILVLKDGRLAEQGVHSELVTAKGIYHSLWSIQHQTQQWEIGKQAAAKGGVPLDEAIQ